MWFNFWKLFIDIYHNLVFKKIENGLSLSKHFFFTYFKCHVSEKPQEAETHNFKAQTVTALMLQAFFFLFVIVARSLKH